MVTTLLGGDCVVNAVRYPLARNVTPERPGVAWWRSAPETSEPIELEWKNGWWLGMGRMRAIDNQVDDTYAYSVGIDCTSFGFFRLAPRRFAVSPTDLLAVQPTFLFEAERSITPTSGVVNRYRYVLNDGAIFKCFVESDNTITIVHERTLESGDGGGRAGRFETRWYLPIQSISTFRELTTVNTHYVLRCFAFDDSAGTFANNTTEAASAGGTAFNLVDAGALADIAYFAASDSAHGGGSSIRFDSFYFDLATLGIGGTIVWEYYNGAWVALTVVDGTSAFTADGYVTWTAPADWIQTTINSALAFWVRARVSVAFTTAPTCNQSVPADKLTTADAGLNSLGFATYQEGTTARFFRGDDTNLVSLAATAPLTAGNWGSGFEVGDTSNEILDIFDTGVTLGVAKGDNLYIFDGTGSNYPIFNINPGAEDEEATLYAIPGTETLFYAHRTGLHLYDGGRVKMGAGIEGISTLAAVPGVTLEPFQIRYRGVIVVGGWVYALGYAVESSTERTYILAGKMFAGPGSIIWHSLDISRAASGETRGLLIDATMKLWTCEGQNSGTEDRITYRQLGWDGSPDAGRDNKGYGAASQQHQLFLPEFVFPFVVQLIRYDFMGENLDSTTPVQLQVQRDHGSLENVSTTIVGDGFVSRAWTPGTNDTGWAIRPVIDLTTTAGYNPATADPQGHYLKLVLQPRPTIRFIVDTGLGYGGGPYSPNSSPIDDPRTIRDNFNNLRGAAAVSATDPDGNSLTLFIQDCTDLSTYMKDNDVHYVLEVTCIESN